MKYKPWGWVNVFEGGKIRVGTKWADINGTPTFLSDITGGEEELTDEVKRVMAALDFVVGRKKLPCGSYYQVGFSFDRSAIGITPARTYFIYLGEHDESE